MKPGYAAIEAAAKKLGYPEHWEDDLYRWDRQFIEQWDPSAFAWMIRRHGTHIIHIGLERETPIFVKHAEAVADWEDDTKQFFVWSTAHNDPHLTHCSDKRTWLEMIRRAEKARLLAQREINEVCKACHVSLICCERDDLCDHAKKQAGLIVGSP